MRRRDFLKMAGCSAAAVSHPGLLPDFLGGVQNACAFGSVPQLSDVEARFYKKLANGATECELCPRHCRVTDLERGYCGVRENRGGSYRTLVYGLPCARNIDPIEKKPLFHFHPGASAFSLATAGCNVNCKFCQNWEISQSRPEQTSNIPMSSRQIVDTCLTRKIPVIAYTYSEPVIFYEYMFDTAELGKEHGLKSVMITGGYIEKEPLTALMPVLDAIKVDLKSIREEYYRDVVRGELGPVLDRLIQMRTAGIWLELVYLIVPTLNDTEQEFTDLARWIKGNLGTDVPIHFSRFHPKYLLTNLPATPLSTLETAHAICRAEGLEYVYLGNVAGHPAESTYCPRCETKLIDRKGYRIQANSLIAGKCPKCHHQLPGVF